MADSYSTGRNDDSVSKVGLAEVCRGCEGVAAAYRPPASGSFGTALTDMHIFNKATINIWE